MNSEALPTITGPEQYIRRKEPPTFYLRPGKNPYFAIEVATHPTLLVKQNQAQRQADNFYGSWAVEGLLAARGATVYQLPSDVWQRLRKAERLYYRLVTSSAPAPNWHNAIASIGEDQIDEAPWITLLDSRRGRNLPSKVLSLDSTQLRRQDEALWKA